MVRTIERIPWSKPKRRPPIQVEKAAATTSPLPNISRRPCELLAMITGYVIDVYLPLPPMASAKA